MKPLPLIRIIFVLGLSAFAFKANSADLVSKENLTAFADQNAYRDNRQTIKRDKLYAASKGCCDSRSPYAVVEAYGGPDAFRQVAMWCDHCGTKAISNEQLAMCQKEFPVLYRKLFQADLAPEIFEKLKIPAKGGPLVISEKQALPKIRLSTGGLKCDGKLGNRFRVDIFVQ